jgi:hypothetical protein
MRSLHSHTPLDLNGNMSLYLNTLFSHTSLALYTLFS